MAGSLSTIRVAGPRSLIESLAGGLVGGGVISEWALVPQPPVRPLRLVVVFAIWLALSQLGISLSGCLLCAAALLAIGARWTTSTLSYARLLRGLAFSALLAAVLPRLWLCDQGPVRVEVWPGGGTRYLNRVVDERDGAVTMPWLMLPGGAPKLVPELRLGYERLDQDTGEVSAPVLSTLAWRQSTEAFDVVVVPPHSPVAAGSTFSVVFLHGYGGNFAVYCWQFAQAIAVLGGTTFCPSTQMDGRWQLPPGRDIAHLAIAEAKRRVPGPVILGGLSNGGIGASSLAAELVGHIEGLILISGCDYKSRLPAELPTLVIHGTRDDMIDVEHARRCAGSRHTLELFNTGHFLLLDHHEAMARVLSRWLSDLI